MTKARVIVEKSVYYGQVGEVTDKYDPRVSGHPQPEHLLWEAFMFFTPDEDGYGIGFMLYELELLV